MWLGQDAIRSMPSTLMRRRSSPRPRIDGRLDTPPAPWRLRPGTSRSRLAVSLVAACRGCWRAASCVTLLKSASVESGAPTTTTVMSGVSGRTGEASLWAAALFQIADMASERAKGRGFLGNSMFFSALLKFCPSLIKRRAAENVTNRRKPCGWRPDCMPFRASTYRASFLACRTASGLGGLRQAEETWTDGCAQHATKCRTAPGGQFVIVHGLESWHDVTNELHLADRPCVTAVASPAGRNRQLRFGVLHDQHRLGYPDALAGQCHAPGSAHGNDPPESTAFRYGQDRGRRRDRRTRRNQDVQPEYGGQRESCLQLLPGRDIAGPAGVARPFPRVQRRRRPRTGKLELHPARRRARAGAPAAG